MQPFYSSPNNKAWRKVHLFFLLLHLYVLFSLFYSLLSSIDFYLSNLIIPHFIPFTSANITNINEFYHIANYDKVLYVILLVLLGDMISSYRVLSHTYIPIHQNIRTSNKAAPHLAKPLHLSHQPHTFIPPHIYSSITLITIHISLYLFLAERLLFIRNILLINQ